MDELIIQVLRGDADPSVAERVHRWRAESAENEAYFVTVARVWSLTVPTPPAGAARPVATTVIVAAAEERRRGGARAEVIPIRRARSRPGLRRSVAGWSVALAAAIAAVTLGVRSDWMAPGPEPLASYLAQAATPRTVSLDDGSFVKLAPGSDLRVWDLEGERRVSLRGRAFFAVAHDAGRPFVVESGGTETRVLGTRFEVSESEGGVRALVVDGRVALSNQQGSVEIPAGSLGRTSEDSAPTTETPEDLYALLDWPSGLMLFQGTPLDRVAREVGRRFGRVLEVQDEALRARRVSGTFEDQSFAEIVLALCETVGAECFLTDDGATIGR